MGNVINNNFYHKDSEVFNEIIEKSRVSKKTKEKLTKYKEMFNNDALNRIDILQFIVEEYLSLKECLLSKYINNIKRQTFKKRFTRLLKWIKMIFENNLKDENLDKNIVNITETPNLTQFDKINYMLFSQANTPTKIIGDRKIENTMNNNFGYNLPILRSNSTNVNVNSHERKKIEMMNLMTNKNKLQEEYKSTIINLNNNENFIISEEIENIKKEEYNQINHTPITKLHTPIKKRGSVSIVSNSYKSNLSYTFGLNTLSLNMVHRGLDIYHTVKKIHFRTRVSKGPPICLRWVSWLVLNNVPVKRSEKIVDFFLSKNIDPELDKIIIKDIDRTFSSLNSNYFNHVLLKNSLYRILKAYAALDTDMGYCQGLNLITAFLLIVCNYNEKDVFYLLISLLSNTFGNNFNIRGFFTEEFKLLKIFIFFFEEIFDKQNKKMKNHFDKLDLPLDVWAGRWFQTLFTICLPVEMCQRLWDCLFSQGPYFIFSFTLALLKEFESKLMLKNENIEIMEFFNKLQNNLASENVNLNQTIDKFNTETTDNFKLNVEKNENNLPKYNFNIENIIKQAIKIKFSDKLITKLKKKYFLSNNNEKDFVEDKFYLNIDFDEIENYVSEFGVDFKNNVMKTVSPNAAYSNNVSVSNFNENNKLNNEFEIVQNNLINVRDLPDLVNDYKTDEEKKENINKKLSLEVDDNNNKNNNFYKNITPECETSIGKKYNKEIKQNTNKHDNLNYSNNLLIGIANIKNSPRFKIESTGFNSKNSPKTDNKKNDLKNAFLKTEINEIGLNEFKADDENFVLGNLGNKKITTINSKNQINLKKVDISDSTQFRLNDFESNINSESKNIINKYDKIKEKNLDKNNFFDEMIKGEMEISKIDSTLNGNKISNLSISDQNSNKNKKISSTTHISEILERNSNVLRLHLNGIKNNDINGNLMNKNYCFTTANKPLLKEFIFTENMQLCNDSLQNNFQTENSYYLQTEIQKENIFKSKNLLSIDPKNDISINNNFSHLKTNNTNYQKIQTLNNRNNSNYLRENDTYEEFINKTENIFNFNRNSNILEKEDVGISNHSSTKDKYLINISNIKKQSSLNIISHAKSIKNNRYSNCHNGIKESKQFDKINPPINIDEDSINKPIEEFTNNELTNNPSRIKNYAINNLRNKSLINFNCSRQYEQNEIKEALFKRTRNNPLYIWKKN